MENTRERTPCVYCLQFAAYHAHAAAQWLYIIIEGRRQKFIKEGANVTAERAREILYTGNHAYQLTHNFHRKPEVNNYCAGGTSRAYTALILMRMR